MKKFTFTAAFFALAASIGLSAVKPDPILPEKLKARIVAAAPQKAAAPAKKVRKILCFSRTQGFRHYQGIVGARFFYQNLADKLGIFTVDFSEDPTVFEADNLKKYDAVILNNSTQAFMADIKDPKNPNNVNMADPEVKKTSDRRCANLMKFVENGGGVFAIHSGVDCYNYPRNRNKPFTDMLGGEFITHPWGCTTIAETFVIDDVNSPITSGIWKKDAFKLQDEIYMVGESYDRTKCRVLIRIDVARSENPSWFDKGGMPKNARKDGDVAMVWIKNYGKGRVAYGAYGHGWNNYALPEIQELYMRLTQFVCGDLKADVTPLPFTNKSVYVPLYDRPAMSQFEALKNLKYGEKDFEINTVLYAAYANNLDKDFCKEAEAFALKELESDSGTALYRAVIAAELLRAVEISSPANCARAQKVLTRLSKASDYDTRGICGRLSNAIDHFQHGKVDFSTRFDKNLVVPQKMPSDWRELTRVIKWLGSHKNAKLPSWLKYSALDERGKAKLLYAQFARGDNMDEAMKLEPKSEELFVAKAFLVSKIGTLADVDSLISSAELISSKGAMRSSSAYLASVNSKDLPKVLIEKMLGQPTPQQSELIAQTLGRLDISTEMNGIYAAYPSMDSQKRVSVLGMMGAIANADVFVNLLKCYKNAAEHPDFRAEQKVLSRCISAVAFNEEMLKALIEAIDCSKNKKETVALMKMLSVSSAPAALECVVSRAASMPDTVVDVLGKWRNSSALPQLLKMAKSSQDNAKIKAQIAMVSVGMRGGFDAESAKYIIDNAVRGEERELAVDAMVKNPSPEIVELLKAKGFDKQAVKAQKVLHSRKPVFNCSFKIDKRAKAKAVNGKLSDYWCSNTGFKAGEWISLDFGYPKKFSVVTFNLGKVFDFPTDCKFSFGSDEKSLVFAPSKVSISKDGKIAVVTLEKPVLARVFKITTTKPFNRHWTISNIAVK